MPRAPWLCPRQEPSRDRGRPGPCRRTQWRPAPQRRLSGLTTRSPQGWLLHKQTSLGSPPWRLRPWPCPNPASRLAGVPRRLALCRREGTDALAAGCPPLQPRHGWPSAPPRPRGAEALSLLLREELRTRRPNMPRDPFTQVAPALTLEPLQICHRSTYLPRPSCITARVRKELSVTPVPLGAAAEPLGRSRVISPFSPSCWLLLVAPLARPQPLPAPTRVVPDRRNLRR